VGPEQNQPPSLASLLENLAALQSGADQAFASVVQRFPREVACGGGCDDCCYAVFDLTPIEALALALAWRRLPRQERREALRRAEKAAAAFDRLSAQALALPAQERIAAFSQARIACPLLSEGRCLAYAARPLTCRLYGIPVATQGASHSCHRSHFKEGVSYPTVDFGKVQAELGRLSQEALALAPLLGPQRRDLARALIWAQSQALTLDALGA